MSHIILVVNSILKTWQKQDFKGLFADCIGIYGGTLLGVRSVSGLAFYDWETTELVRRIEITPKQVSMCKRLSQNGSKFITNRLWELINNILIVILLLFIHLLYCSL